jgi:hypothetical protein
LILSETKRVYSIHNSHRRIENEKKRSDCKEKKQQERLEDSSCADKKKDERTQAPSNLEETKALLPRAPTLLLQARTKARNIASPFPHQKAFPSKSAAKSRFRTRKIVGLPVHMMP